MNRPWVVPTVIGVLMLIITITVANLAGALGRISVLMEDAVKAEAQTDTATMATDSTISALQESFAEALAEVEESSVALEEAQEEIDSAERTAETSFRRAERLAEDNPVLEQAIQEMRGDAIVTSMEHEAREEISAATILRQSTRIRQLSGLFDGVTETLGRERAANAAEHAIKDQIISEQQRALAPSFLTKLLAMPEVAAFGGLVGAAATYVVTR